MSRVGKLEFRSQETGSSPGEENVQVLAAAGNSGIRNYSGDAFLVSALSATGEISIDNSRQPVLGNRSTNMAPVGSKAHMGQE